MKKLVLLLLLVLSATMLSAREIGSYFKLNAEKLFEIKDDIGVDQVIQDVIGPEGAMQFQMYKGIEMQVKANLKSIEAYCFADKDQKVDMLIILTAPETTTLDMYIPMAFVQEGDHYAIMDQYKEGLKSMGYKENFVLKKEGTTYLLASDIALIEERSQIEADLKKVKYYEYIKEDSDKLTCSYSNLNVSVNYDFSSNPQLKEMMELMKPFMDYMVNTFNYGGGYSKYVKSEGMFYIKGETVDKASNKSSETYIKFPIGIFEQYAKLMGTMIKMTMEQQQAMNNQMGGMNNNAYEPTSEELQMLQDYNQEY